MQRSANCKKTYYVLRIPYYVLRITFYVLRVTYHVLRITYYVLRITYYVLRIMYYVLRAAVILLPEDSPKTRTTAYMLNLQGRCCDVSSRSLSQNTQLHTC